MTDSAILASVFNNHFATIAKQIKAKSIIPNLHFSKYLFKPVEEALIFRPIDQLEVTFTKCKENICVLQAFQITF